MRGIVMGPATFVILFIVVALLGLGLLILGLGRTRRRDRRICPDATCGHRNAPSAHFCARCGHKLGDDDLLGHE